jgi:HNH endonuclease
MVWTLYDNFKGHFNRVGHKGKKGSAHPCWKGGKIIDRNGYIRTWAPNHPWPRKGYILEHTRIVELKIGRRILSTECVHHKDHDKQNNSSNNLLLLSRKAHSALHRKLDSHTFRRGKGGRYVALSGNER